MKKVIVNLKAIIIGSVLGLIICGSLYVIYEHVETARKIERIESYNRRIDELVIKHREESIFNNLNK